MPTTTVEYIVFWQDDDKKQISTTVDAKNLPVTRDLTYVTTNDIPILEDSGAVFTALENSTGDKYAVTTDLARSALGWDV